jgi:hypothetical protein
MQRYDLETSLAEAQKTISEMQSALSSKDNDNQAIQNKILKLAAELDREITHSLELHSSLDEKHSHNQELISQTENLAEQLLNLRNLINEKEESLLNEEENKEKILKEHDKLQKEFSMLQKDKSDLEQKYMNQLNLVLKQQELVNQLSNELTAQKRISKDLEQQNRAIAERDFETRTTPHTYSEEASFSNENTHVVRNGETLSSISVQYYGNPSRWYDIYNANRDLINDAYEVEPGTEIIIPN